MQKRNIGLDAIRAIAILLVLIDHSAYFFPQFDVFNPLQVFGFYGVELFFVLSGFLIGRIILRSFLKDFSRNSLKSFYARRWLRTLPLYYIILTTFIIFSNFIYKTQAIHILHFLFLQNFLTTERYFFSISWSLAIEEWFYLLLPVILYFIFRKSASSKKLFLRILSLITLIIVLRTIYVLTFNPSFEVVRVFVPLRFDSLLLGVLLAFIKADFSWIYKKMQDVKIFFVSLFLLFATSVYYIMTFVYKQSATSFIFETAGFTVVSFLITLLIPFMENNEKMYGFLTKYKLVASVIISTSLLSYSLYLLHLEIFTLYRVELGRFFSPFILIIFGLISCFIASAGTYFLIEKPFLSLRNRFFKT